ncbi:MAG: hypothetical protein NZM00_09585 [Anaerolinea sp.]|nr:hypothetical protein [Anaerolinea sp.]
MIKRMIKRLKIPGALVLLALTATACSIVGGVNVPSTGDTANDASAAQQFLPSSLPGYIVTEAQSLSSALSGIAGGAALLTGNPVLAGLVAQLDGMMACYNATGSVAARVYVQANVSSLLSGEIPSAGVMAVINQDRVINNFLACALGSGPEAFSAQARSIQPCGSSGSFVVNGETLLYLYAATDPQLCAAFQSRIPAG